MKACILIAEDTCPTKGVRSLGLVRRMANAKDIWNFYHDPFDVVFSNGFIEHFFDAAPVIFIGSKKENIERGVACL